MKRLHLTIQVSPWEAAVGVSRDDFHDGVYLFQRSAFRFAPGILAGRTGPHRQNKSVSTSKGILQERNDEIRQKKKRDDEWGWPISRASMSPFWVYEIPVIRFLQLDDGSSSPVMLTEWGEKRWECQSKLSSFTWHYSSVFLWKSPFYDRFHFPDAIGILGWIRFLVNNNT